MSYVLGARSMANLIGVHPTLVDIVRHAILITQQDFSVNDGVRSLAAQKILLRNGASWTLASKHLVQADGYGHAVDLVPFIGGRLRWDWNGCYAIASAMSNAAMAADADLVWGGVWDRKMAGYGRSPTVIADASADYVARRETADLRAAIDGVHFELAGFV